MRVALKQDLIAVSDGTGESYGGNQLLLSDETERSVGCGVVAALDLLLYLSRYHGASVRLPEIPSAADVVSSAEYARLAHALRRRFLLLIPGHGISGLALAVGLNRCFRKNALPYAAAWGVPYRRLWAEMESMLGRDIPVILAIGPNYPRLWQRHALALHENGREGAAARAHYVTVTGMDDERLRVSSWGRRYEIRRDEFLSYAKKHSARLFCNILVIRRRL